MKGITPKGNLKIKGMGTYAKTREKLGSINEPVTFISACRRKKICATCVKNPCGTMWLRYWEPCNDYKKAVGKAVKKVGRKSLPKTQRKSNSKT